MYTIDDLKTNRDAQITVGSIVSFLLAFPIYFGMAAGNADGSLGGGVADYQVNGEITYVQLDSGSEPIGNGDPWTDTFNPDAINNFLTLTAKDDDDPENDDKGDDEGDESGGD